jgi:S-DNA-T family DNA segregation ATPase FtsK/SpoIIIE
MAKRKKRTKRKQTKAEDKSNFWPMAGGALLILIAIFALLGGFGAGGPLPESLFNGAYWALGWAAYMMPLALVFFGVLKFTSEDHQIPLSKNISMVAFLIFFASWLHVAFVSGNQEVGYSGNAGGAVGSLVGNVTLNAINKMPASIMFFVFTMLAFFFAFNISPDVLLKLGGLFKRRESGDSDLEKLKADSDFKINEGVPIERHGRASLGLKNSAQKLTAQENHEALITTSDPTWKLPSIDLLNQKQDKADPGNVEEKSDIIKNALANFNIDVKMEGANVGPRVTQYTLKPSAGVKLNKLAGYADNLAYSLAATSIRVEAPIPGKTAVGVEVPNEKSLP